MESLNHHEISQLMLSLAVLLGFSRLLGEFARKLQQPSVVGELLAGVLLGPTLLGRFAPEWHAALFPAQGHVAVVFSGMTTLAITLFLLVAGMEVDLSSAWRQGAVAFKVGLLGMLVPFIVGFAGAWFTPRLMGAHADADHLIFALFFATALSISALPVIARTLMDLNLYRSDLGMVIVSAAVFNDLVGWIVFALILGLMGSDGNSGGTIWLTIILTLAFSFGMLTVGRSLIHRILPYIQTHTHWPGGVLSFAFCITLLGAALTEWIGVHAIFGAFLVGVAIGDSSHLREQTRSTIDHFVSFIFAPLFFGSIGLHIDFTAHFDVALVATVLAIACTTKLAGCWAGAWWAGMSRRHRWAVGFGMNARGAMEIILGLLALQAGVIRMRLFVALVVMAIVTSMLSGPLMQRVLARRRLKNVAGLLNSERFIRSLRGRTRNEVIRELAAVACSGTSLNVNDVERAVLQREETMPTAIGNAAALPHSHLDGLTFPIAAIGLSEAGVDFNSPDGVPVHVVIMILTPHRDSAVQLEILADLAGLFRSPGVLEKVQRAADFSELLAALKTEENFEIDGEKKTLGSSIDGTALVRN